MLLGPIATSAGEAVHDDGRAWQGKTTHFMVARKQRVKERKGARDKICHSKACPQ